MTVQNKFQNLETNQLILWNMVKEEIFIDSSATKKYVNFCMMKNCLATRNEATKFVE